MNLKRITAILLSLILAALCFGGVFTVSTAASNTYAEGSDPAPAFTALVPAAEGDSLAQGNVPAFELVGAQLRLTDPTGLRFVARISKELINNANADYANVSYGILVQRSDYTDWKLTMDDVSTGTVSSGCAVAVPGTYTFAEYDDYLYYTAVVTGIPAEMFRLGLIARPYLQYGSSVLYATEEDGTDYQVNNAVAVAGGYCVSLRDIAESLENDPSCGAQVTDLYLSTVEDLLARAVENLADSVDLSAFKIPKDEIMKYYLRMYYAHPEFFYIDSGCAYGYDSEGFVTEVLPDYRVNVADIPAMKTELEEKVSEILSDPPDLRSDWDKCVFVHDYLVAHAEYDNTYSFRDAYTFLTQNTGVCQGYTLTYSLLLQRLGVLTDAALSDDMDHVWNRVRIDGKWYNVDVTWDDPDGAFPGAAQHDFFLLSDDRIQNFDGKEPHFNWYNVNYPNPCVSDDYDYAFWHDGCNSPFAQQWGMWHTIAKDGSNYVLCSVGNDGNGCFPLVELNYVWYTDSSRTSYWDGFYSGLINYQGSGFILNSYDEVVVYDRIFQRFETIYTNTDPNMGIYSIYQDSDGLFCVLSDNPNGDAMIVRIGD